MAVAGITFEQAKTELRAIGRRYEAGIIDRHAWCHGVHEVILRFQAGVDEAPVDATTAPATAAPRVADPPQTSAAEVPIVVTDRDTVHRHLMVGQGP